VAKLFKHYLSSSFPRSLVTFPHANFVRHPAQRRAAPRKLFRDDASRHRASGKRPFYFIADYHSMTSLFDADERRKNSLDVALDFLACGLDPKKSVFFKQSDVPEVTELAWLLT